MNDAPLCTILYLKCDMQWIDIFHHKYNNLLQAGNMYMISLVSKPSVNTKNSNLIICNLQQQIFFTAIWITTRLYRLHNTYHLFFKENFNIIQSQASKLKLQISQ
jgi:hypothetical protein